MMHSQTTTTRPHAIIQNGALLVGIGRSGTTFLSELIGTSPTPMRLIVEPLPRVTVQPEPIDSCEPWHVSPDLQSANYRWALSTLHALRTSCEIVRENLRASTIRRNDINARALIVKEVHGLLAAPMLLEDLGWRGIVITRDTARVIDSYFVGHSRRQRTYLVDEAALVRRYILNPMLIPDRLRELWHLTLNTASLDAIHYLRRPRLWSRELIRQTCITHFLSMWLTAWASLDSRVLHISYEDLCRQPVRETIRAFHFLHLDYDHKTLSSIRRLSQGTSQDYYSIHKNSMLTLNKPFAYLKPSARRRIAKYLVGPIGVRPRVLFSERVGNVRITP